jgi:hypothetical protein
MVSISTIENAAFSIIIEPRDPNLYEAGTGNFFWASGMTFEFAIPECYVTGNITYQGQTIDFIPETSKACYDRQFGTGPGINGWNLFILLLDNGVSTTF